MKPTMTSEDDNNNNYQQKKTTLDDSTIPIVPNRIQHQEYACLTAATDESNDACTSVTAATATTNKPAALWMSGKWGVGFRIPAGGMDPPIIDNQFIPHFQVQELVQQAVALQASWVIVNLSAGAFGDRYLSYHPVLATLNPGSTPPEHGRRDLWGEIASALHAHGIACFAYVATQGPAMLKHGPTKAYDYDATTGTAPSIQRWHEYVQEHYGNDTVETLHYAFADVIIQYYAKHYGNLIDGWWFDHAHFGNIPLLHDMVKKYNPNTVVAFNRGRKVPLHNNNPGYEDYTSGHPTPLRQHPPSNMINEPMVASIEATCDGFFRGPLQEMSLGHVYMPMGLTWNGIGSDNGWCHCHAVDWMGRVLQAKGAWTWNLPRQGNNPYDASSSSRLDVDMVEFIKGVVGDLKLGGDEKSCCSCCSANCTANTR